MGFSEILPHTASVHLPRIGYSTPNFNWYGTERLVRKHLTSAGIPTYMYPSVLSASVSSPVFMPVNMSIHELSTNLKNSILDMCQILLSTQCARYHYLSPLHLLTTHSHLLTRHPPSPLLTRHPPSPLFPAAPYPPPTARHLLRSGGLPPWLPGAGGTEEGEGEVPGGL